MKFVLHILANATALILSDVFIPGVSLHISDSLSDIRIILALLGMSFTLFIINTFIRPLLKIVLFPFIILSLGIVSVIINLGLLKLFDWLTPLISIQGLFSLVFCSIIISMVNMVFSQLND